VIELHPVEVGAFRGREPALTEVEGAPAPHKNRMTEGNKESIGSLAWRTPFAFLDLGIRPGRG